MAVDFAQPFAADADLPVTVTTIPFSGRRYEYLRQADIFLNPVVERGVSAFGPAFRLLFAQQLEGRAALEHALEAPPQVAAPLNHVHRFAQIALVMSIAARERRQPPAGEQLRRPVVLGERTLRAEQFESRRAAIEPFQGVQPHSQQSIL